MNDTIGKNRLVPSLLVVGIIPKFSVIAVNILSQKKRVNMLVSDQVEMKAIVAERQIEAAIKHNA